MFGGNRDILRELPGVQIEGTKFNPGLTHIDVLLHELQVTVAKSNVEKPHGILAACNPHGNACCLWEKLL